MGDYAKAVFGREKLPDIAIIRAGAHFEERAKRTLDQFDKVGEFHGMWMPYCYATYNDFETLVIFNVYGAASTLEVVRLLEEGGVKCIGFIGSAWSKNDPVGQQLLVRKVYDQAGVVLLDGVEVIDRDEEELQLQREIYDEQEVDFSEVNLVSVPSVMHNITSVREFVAQDKVDALEMELSTLFHFCRQSGIQAYAFVYVSDNPANPTLKQDKQAIRNDAMILSTKLLLNLLDRITF